jgi:hypothetical protein
MSVTVNCDRCNDPIEDHSSNRHLEVTMGYTKVDDAGNSLSFKERWDICSGCRKKLMPALMVLIRDHVVRATDESITKTRLFGVAW